MSCCDGISGGSSVLTQTSDFINVKLLGAVGNGVNDDSSYFAQAVALASNSNANSSGREIYAPRGTYLVDSGVIAAASQKSIAIFGELTVFGLAGFPVTTIKCRSVTATDALVYCAGRMRLENLILDCALPTVGATSYGVLNEANCTVELIHVIVTSAAVAGVAFNNAGGSRMMSCTVGSCPIGVRVWGGNGTLLHDLQCSNCSDCGVEVQGMFWPGTTAADATSIQIADMGTFEGNGTNLVDLNGTSAAIRLLGTGGVRISGGYIENSTTAHGIYLNDCNNTLLEQIRNIPDGSPGRFVRARSCLSTTVRSCLSANTPAPNTYRNISWSANGGVLVGEAPENQQSYHDSRILNLDPLPVVEE